MSINANYHQPFNEAHLVMAELTGLTPDTIIIVSDYLANGITSGLYLNFGAVF